MLCFTMSHMGTCSGEPEGRQKIQFPETFRVGLVPHEASRTASDLPGSECDAVVLLTRSHRLRRATQPEVLIVHLGPGAPNSAGVPVDRVSLRLDPSSYLVTARNRVLESSIKTVRERRSAYVRGWASTAM